MDAKRCYDESGQEKTLIFVKPDRRSLWTRNMKIKQKR